MFTTQKTRLERQLVNLKGRIDRLGQEIKALPAYQDRQERWNRELQGLSEQEREAWFARRQLEHDRERLMNLEMLELTGPSGDKSREYVELLKREREREELEGERERLQAQLQRIALAREEAVWFWIGFAVSFALFFAVLFTTFKLPIWVSLLGAYWATALLSQVQHIHRLNRRILDVLVYEAAQRVASQQRIPLPKAEKQVEEWRWV
jgi:hypothetical protein